MRFTERIRSFMYGRNGIDPFGIFLLIFSCLLSFILRIFNLHLLVMISSIPLIYMIYRMLSKNIKARRNENQMFLNLWSPIKEWFIIKKNRNSDKKTHKYYKCPKCKQTVRVPKFRGKIKIICPKCKNEFVRKT